MAAPHYVDPTHIPTRAKDSARIRVGGGSCQPVFTFKRCMYDIMIVCRLERANGFRSSRVANGRLGQLVTHPRCIARSCRTSDERRL